MSTTSGNDHRDQMFQRLEDAISRPPDSVETVMASPEHARLLTLISEKKPSNIARLYKIAKDDENRVSRQLSILMRSGLVNVIGMDRNRQVIPTPLGIAALSRLTPRPILSM